MKVTVTTLSDAIFVLDVNEDLELENFKAFCEVESGFPAHEIMIVHEGKPLVDNTFSLKKHGIKDGDVVILQRITNSTHNVQKSSTSSIPQLDFSGISIPENLRRQNPAVNTGTSIARSSNAMEDEITVGPNDDPAMIRDIFLKNPDQLALLKQNNPRLADALSSGNLESFSKVLKEQLQEKEKRVKQRERMLRAHPLDIEAQRLIAEEIRQKNIEANMEAAMEYNPESFGTVLMLYINCTVNGHPVKAFIDSGAQTTIMSAACAERVNIMRLVDTRWAGIAKGVGVQKIIGRVHMVQIAIENDYLTTAFSVLEVQNMDMLLGLDMLRRHQCCIDLKNNVLRIGTTGTETRFLSESELPSNARLSNDESYSKKNDQSTTSNIQNAGSSQNQSSNSVDTIADSDKFNEETIKELESYGFTRDQVIQALRKQNGDKLQATALLFAKSIEQILDANHGQNRLTF